MKKVILFEQFIAEAKSTEEIAAKILGELDKNAQLYADYIPKEALGAINKALKKNKSLIGKDAELAAKQIRMNLEDIGILSNTLSPFDVEMIIMNHLNESLVNEANDIKVGSFVRYKKDKDFTGGKVLSIKDDIVEISNWDGSTAELPLKDLEYVKSWNESLVNEAKFKVGDSWEWNHVDGVKIVTITNVKPNGDVVAKAEGESQDFIVRDANKYLKKKVNESLVNEAKELDRDALMNLLETKYKIKTVRTSEEFNGQTEGIWVAGDNGEEMSGNKIFDYYNSSAKYANGILKQVRAAVEKTGWWFEWNDPGTLIIWPKNL
jgi:hypothetical protein